MRILVALRNSCAGRPVGQFVAGDSHQQRIDRGQYIVHHVAMCIYCHTPKSETGELNRRELLQGAPMPVESPFTGQPWAFRAPAIAGLPGGWSEEETSRFLTGQPPRGVPPRPPMPPFRMTREDAEAVAAYLKSLR